MSAEDAAPPQRLDAEVVDDGAPRGAIRRLRLRVGGDWPSSLPGQFVMLTPGVRGSVPRLDPLLPRPMAIYRTRRAHGEAEIEVLYKVVGRGTALLADAGPGDRVGVFGPLGRGFAAPPPGAGAVLVGGGTGIASLFDLAALARVQGPTCVLLGARRAEDLMGREDFESLGVELRIATDDGSEGHRGPVTELMPAWLARLPDAPVYACGPTPMMRRAVEIAGARCSVSVENRMACGYGVCLGCAVPRAAGGFALVCRDGPVFGSRELAWEGLA